ncbi:ParB/RepB/Spo0J family partition protein [Deinococcus ruber]|uniref:Chromosome 2-partitioning protein ParB n=1 Tax=Deinococcus ruber TaxID=1848197 RepID=A0A918CCL9_9DEIO|nr:ParB/RepB/Spo0J family partition protein [Deinococcus ruber]GGR16227.1 putative chromosome 2-partitioning protein ParB [Deinococcus ruber]
MTGRSKKPAPGARLAGLITSAAEETPTSLPLTDIRTGAAHQPRRRAEDANLQELAASIRVKGILQPLLVRPTASGYELVAGERRLRAAELAGLTEVPVLIRELTDAEALEAALIENLQREGMEIIDEVDATLTLVANRLGIPRDQARHRLMAQRTRDAQAEDLPELEALFALLGRGTWQSFVKNKLRILNWPDTVLAAMRDHGLAYSIAGIIAAAPTEHQAELLAYALTKTSKAQVRTRAKTLNPPKSRRIDRQRTILMARKLASERWLASLNDQDEKELEAWLKKMPERIRQAVEPGGA